MAEPRVARLIVDHNDYYFLNMEEDTAHASMQGVLPWDFTGAGAPAASFGVDYRKETMVSNADPLRLGRRPWRRQFRADQRRVQHRRRLWRT